MDHVDATGGPSQPALRRSTSSPTTGLGPWSSRSRDDGQGIVGSPDHGAGAVDGAGRSQTAPPSRERLRSTRRRTVRRRSSSHRPRRSVGRASRRSAPGAPGASASSRSRRGRVRPWPSGVPSAGPAGAEPRRRAASSPGRQAAGSPAASHRRRRPSAAPRPRRPRPAPPPPMRGRPRAAAPGDPRSRPDEARDPGRFGDRPVPGRHELVRRVGLRGRRREDAGHPGDRVRLREHEQDLHLGA